MIPGFVIELHNTDLDDFVDHINFGVREFAKWYGPNGPIGDTRIFWTQQAQGSGATYPDDILISGNVVDLGLWINISLAQNRRTVRIWDAIFNSDRSAEHNYFESMFTLMAVRYQRDRFQVFFLDQGEGDEQERANKALEWLKFHWGDAVKEPRAVNERDRQEVNTLNAVKGSAGRPTKSLYDQTWEILSRRDDGQKSGNPGFEEAYKWWLNQIGKKHSKSLKHQFSEAMKRRVKKEQDRNQVRN